MPRPNVVIYLKAGIVESVLCTDPDSIGQVLVRDVDEKHHPDEAVVLTHHNPVDIDRISDEQFDRLASSFDLEPEDEALTL